MVIERSLADGTTVTGSASRAHHMAKNLVRPGDWIAGP